MTAKKTILAAAMLILGAHAQAQQTPTSGTLVIVPAQGLSLIHI